MTNVDNSRNPHHLRRRGKNGIWWFRCKPRFMKNEINTSLHTSDKKTAIAKRNEFLVDIMEGAAKKKLSMILLLHCVSSDSESREAVNQMAPGYLDKQEKPRAKKLSQMRELFLEQRHKVRKLKVASINGYKVALEHFQGIIGDKHVDNITPPDIEHYIAEAHKMEHAKRLKSDLSARTVANRFKALVSFFDWLRKMRYIRESPAADIDCPAYTVYNTLSPPYELVDQLCSIPYPEGCPISKETWSVFPYVFRYTGARLGEVARLESKDIIIKDKIPTLSFIAEKAQHRKRNIFPDGRKLVPIHPKLLVLLEKLAEQRAHRLFPDVGEAEDRYGDLSDIRYGHIFRGWWIKRAKQIWPKMKIHSWRSYVMSYLTKEAGVRESVAEDIAGHAGGTVNRDYAGRSYLPTLYRAIRKLP